VPRDYSYPVEIPASIYLQEVGLTVSFGFVEKPDRAKMARQSQSAFMDYDRLCPPLILRNVRPGDRIEPLGMIGQKKLKDYFIDRKIPYKTRRGIPLLVDSQSVVWIAGERVSERAKVREATKRVLKAEMV
jgi:tRNA(Ile)-lysidine synthase